MLRWCWAILVIGFLLTPFVAYAEYRAGMPREYWDPLQYPMFADLLEYQATFRLLHTAAFFHPAQASAFAYPPFAAILFLVLYGSGHPVFVYLVTAGLALLAMLAWSARAFVRIGIYRKTAVAFMLSLAITSFPLARMIPQGNVELFLWIFVVAGLWFYAEGNLYQAAICWGLGAAIKLFPLALLLLFSRHLRIRPLLAGICTFLVATWLSLLYMGPTLSIAVRGAIDDVLGYQDKKVGQWTMNIVATNHSIFTLVKAVAEVFGIPFSKLTLPYYLVGGAIFVLLYVVRLRKMPFPNQLLATSLIMVMLPTVSFFHTLVHLYAPWLLLALVAIDAHRERKRVPGLNTTICLMLPLFLSFTLYSFRSAFLFAGIIQAILLFFLMLYAVQYPFVLHGRRMDGDLLLASPNQP